MLKIVLNGVFRVESPCGKDLTPKSQKAQALLALLATGSKFTRSRQWLQSKLWSDRGPAQAAGSLRQALVQVRSALGPEWRDAIFSDRSRVTLENSKVEVAEQNSCEFLEGIDARDPEFEYWLATKRQEEPIANAAQVAIGFTPKRRAISLCYEAVGNEVSNWFARVFLDAVARHIREMFSSELILSSFENPRPVDWQIKLNTFAKDSTIGVRASLENPATGCQLWSASKHVRMRGGPPIDDPEVMRLLNELIQAVGDSLIHEGEELPDDPDQLCRKAIRLIFSTREDPVREAEALLKRAFELEPRGLYLAWRAQLKTIQGIERHFGDDQAIFEEGEQLVEEALQLEPNNSMVLATVANTCGHLLKNHSRALVLARNSVMHNPANPLGWWALSSANSYAGDAKTAYQNARHAQEMALLSPHKFWWDSQVFGSALTLGNLKEALTYAENSNALNPAYRPNLRYLIAFYANAGREEEALEAARRLAELEPDFSIERLVGDPEYPASLLRRAPGIDLGRVAALT